MVLANVFDWFPPIAKVANTLILVLIFYGVAVRRRTLLHMKVMTTCFVLDVINVVVVEVGARFRDKGAEDPQQNVGAVEEGLRSFFDDPGSLLNLHILVSTICIVCYVTALISGRRLYKKGTGRGFHKGNAVVFLVTRIASFVTSFMV